MPLTLFHHRTRHKFNSIKDSGKICLNNILKFFLRHLHNQIVSCNSGIIYQNINSSIFFYHAAEKFFRLLKIADIALNGLRFTAIFFNLRNDLVGTLFGTIIINNYHCTFAGKRFCSCSSDSSASTGNDCYFVL